MECWAATLGDCAGGRSREHYISDAIFDDQAVTVFGLDWCKQHPKEIGLANAVANILCRHHNGALSLFDAEAAKLSRFLSSNLSHDPLADAQLSLSGPLLERWAVKTYVNLGYLGGLDPETHRRMNPAAHLVEYLFQDAVPRAAIGLYHIRGAVSNDDFAVGLSWNGIRNQSRNGSIGGMTFTLNGVRFVVSGDPELSDQQITRLGVVHGVDYASQKVVFRPANITFKSRTAGTKTIQLKW